MYVFGSDMKTSAAERFAAQDAIDKVPFGKDFNAIVWPRGPPDDDDDEEGPENFKNQRFMRIGLGSSFLTPDQSY